MSVTKIESMEYVYLKENCGNIIDIHLNEQWTPCLLGTSYCDRITVWWDSGATEYDEAISLYAIETVEDERDLVNKVESWYEPDLTEALQFVGENLT